MNLAGRGLLLVWTDVDAAVEPGFDAWYDGDHVRERVQGIPGVLRGRRFVAYRGGPKHLAAYDMTHPSVMTSQPYLALRGARDPDSRHFIPLFRNTCKLVGSVTAGDERAEGCVCALLTPSAASQSLRLEMRERIVPRTITQPGIVAVRYAECEPDVVARTRELNPRSGDRFLDSVLMIEATSDEAVTEALAGLPPETLASGRTAADAAVRLRFRYGLHACATRGDAI